MSKKLFLMTSLIMFSSCSSFVKREVANSTSHNEIIVVGESAKNLYLSGEEIEELIDIKQEVNENSKRYSGYYRVLTYKESVLPYANCFKKVQGRIFDKNGQEKRGRLQGLKYLLVGLPNIASEEVYQKNYYCRVYTRDVN